MPDRIAFFSDRSPERVPEHWPNPQDAVATFSTPGELARASDLRSMDALRARLLDTGVVPSKSREESASMLWSAVMATRESPWAGIAEVWSRTHVRDLLGNRKFDTSNLELIELSHFPGKDPAKDFLFSKLAAIFRRTFLIFLDEYFATSKWIWTSHQMVEIARANYPRLKTAQEPLLAFRVSRSKLIARGFLRKVTYEEFVSSPKYRGVSLV